MIQSHILSTKLQQVGLVTASIIALLVLTTSTGYAQASNYSYTVQAGDGVTNLILD